MSRLAASRRSLAGAASLLLIAAAAGPAKAAELDGGLLHLVEAFVTHITAERATVEAMTPGEREQHHFARVVAPWGNVASKTAVLAEEIARIPARTPEGIQAKARALLWLQGGTDAGIPGLALGDGLFESLLADVTGTPCRFRSAARPSVVAGAA